MTAPMRRLLSMRRAVLGAAAALALPAMASEAAGISSGLAAQLHRGVASGELAHLHGVVILRQGALAFEGVQYGDHGYLAPRRNGTQAVTGFGYGGQRLVPVPVPAQQRVYVIFMGRYQRADQLERVFAVQDLVHGALR